MPTLVAKMNSTDDGGKEQEKNGGPAPVGSPKGALNIGSEENEKTPAEKAKNQEGGNGK